MKKVIKHNENNYMQYWLMKLEPDVWSINQQKKQAQRAYPGMV